MRYKCHKDDHTVPFLCSCDSCSRAAAAGWSSKMDRVHVGEISLTEAQQLDSIDLVHRASAARIAARGDL